jgi:D-alanyl-D-alanine carboxypeptidase
MQELTEKERATSRTLARWIAIVLGSLLVMLVVFGVWQRRGISNVARNWSDLSDGSALARELRGTQNVLEYIVSHANDVSLVAYRLGDEAHGIYLNPDRLRPVASTVKLLILCDYNRAISAGELRPDEAVSIAEWEKYWLPGTDGGAHEQTLGQLRAGGVTGDKVQLQDLAYGMTRFSDNAAADYLMQRLGRAQLASLPARLGLANEQPPLPLSGLFLSWENTRESAEGPALLERYTAVGASAYGDEVWRLMRALHDDPQLRAAERARLTSQGLTLRLGEQAALARALTPRGSARGYAELMARIQRGELPGSTAIAAELQWPMQQPGIADRFAQLGTKGGSLPGILTSATFATPHSKQSARVVALFFEGMPMAVWLELMHSFVHQRFEQQLLDDDAFFERVRARVDAIAPK